jgi:hypothetical protein
MGPIVSEGQYQKVLNYIRKGKIISNSANLSFFELLIFFLNESHVMMPACIG